MYLYHVTTLNKEIQSILKPRIPKKTTVDEDFYIERISLAPTILDCLKAIDIIEKLENDSISMRVYKVKIDEEDENLKDLKYLYQKGLVPDAPLTHEYWYTEPIIPVECSIYKISNCTKKKYLIVNSNKGKYIKELIKGMEINDDSFINLNAFEIMNLWLPNQSESVQNKLREQLVRLVIEDSDDIEFYKKIFNEIPKTEHIESDYLEFNYLEKCCMNCEETIKNRGKFIFDKCSFEEIKQSREDFHLVLLAWKLLDPQYVDNNNCYLYSIKDEFKNVIAFLYYHFYREYLYISSFEVIPSLRNLGFGKKIIQQFLNEKSINVDNIRLESISDEAARFWKSCGIPCYHPGEDL